MICPQAVNWLYSAVLPISASWQALASDFFCGNELFKSSTKRFLVFLPLEHEQKILLRNCFRVLEVIKKGDGCSRHYSVFSQCSILTKLKETKAFAQLYTCHDLTTMQREPGICASSFARI